MYLWLLLWHMEGTIDLSLPLWGRTVLRGCNLSSEGATCPQKGRHVLRRGRPVLRRSDLSSEGATCPQRGRPFLRRGDPSSEGATCPQRGRPALRRGDMSSEGATCPQKGRPVLRGGDLSSEGDLSSGGATCPRRERPFLRRGDLSWRVDERNVLRTSCPCHGIGRGFPNGFPQKWLIRIDIYMYNVHVYFLIRHMLFSEYPLHFR